MRKLYMIFIGAMLLLCMACEDFKFGNAFLDKPITTDITIDTVFNHKKYADQVLAEVYLSLPDFLVSDNRLGADWREGLLERLTDLGDCSSDPQCVFHAGQVTASTNLDEMPYRLDDRASYLKYGSPMGGMRIGYIYLDNVDRVPDMTSREKAIRKAEVKTIMAFHYMQMLRYYGGMPWVDRIYEANDKVELPRMTVEEHVRKVVELCDEAAKVLPWSVTSEEDGHMTAASALAVKSRTLQFAASPLFNSEKPYMEGEAAEARCTWYGNYDAQRWRDALDASLELLDRNQNNGGYYHLVDNGDPRSSFLSGYYDRHNTEVLLAGHRYKKIPGSYWSAFCDRLRWGCTRPSAVLGDMFEWKDGQPFDWKNKEHAATPFFDKNGNMTRDPRLYETLVVNGDKLKERKAELYLGGRESWDGTGSDKQSLRRNAWNGYGLRKFALDMNAEFAGRYYSCPHIRLSEIYLNIAEAMNALNMANQPDRFGRNAYDYINLVRNRVDMPDLDKGRYPEGKELQEAILHERAVEFAFEEIRYFDINRWKKKEYMDVQPFRLKIYKDEDGSMRYERTPDIEVPRMWVENWSDRYYLLPIPTEELNKNYGLIQNPGW